MSNEETHSYADNNVTVYTQAATASSSSSSSKKARKIIWKHVLDNEDISFSSTTFTGPLLPEHDSARLPIEYFNDFVSDELKNLIVEQSNLYSSQNDILKPLNLTLSELEQWAGNGHVLFPKQNT